MKISKILFFNTNTKRKKLFLVSFNIFTLYHFQTFHIIYGKE